jgi:nucleolar MIF4G domain-containing protein 1
VSKISLLYSVISKPCTANTVDMVISLLDNLDRSTDLGLDVTSAVTSIVIVSISTHSTLLDSYVVLHAALVSGLHRVIGNEFGRVPLFAGYCYQLSLGAAHFLQNVVSSYESHYIALNSTIGDAIGETSASGKECSNLIVLLSELYNFQVISCVLIYDIIRDLLSAELTEPIVELLLKLLRSTYQTSERGNMAKLVRDSGQQLRQDDPSALKDIVQIVQSKALDAEKPSKYAIVYPS